MRVLARDHAEVDDGWLCDAGRFAYPAQGGAATVAGAPRVTEPLVRDGGELRAVSWERALQEAASGLERAGERAGAIVGGEATSEEGLLLARLMREGLRSPHLDSRPAGRLPLELHRALSDPRLQAKVSDLEFAHAVLVLDADPITDAPILDLRLRKGVRRHGMKLVRAEGSDLSALRELATKLSQEGPEIVVLWGERFTAGPNGADAAAALLDIAATLSMEDTEGAGLLEIPAHSNGRGLREAGVLANAGPGLSGAPQEGLDATGITEGLIAGELSALYLLRADPLQQTDPWARAPLPARSAWERALAQASTVVAHATFLSEGIREHANVVFPAESYAEKEGTVTHPDGRIQRLRAAVAHPGQTRPEWSVIAELAARLGLDLEVPSVRVASQQLFDAVPFYAGLTLEEIGGRGVRWQERPQAIAHTAVSA